MQLTQIVDYQSPIAHWTGERFNPTNVYSEDNVTTLVNANATLGEVGHANTYLSSKSINLKGGHLYVNDIEFLNPQLVSRKLVLSFAFRLNKGAIISGFRPILSKWNPSQSFVIGIENNVLTAHIQTSSGVESLSFDRVGLINHGNWNWVQLVIEPGFINLYCNGNRRMLANSDSIITVLSNFIVGGEGSEQWTDDCFIANISACETNNSSFPAASFHLPRSHQDICLAQGASYYYDLPSDDYLGTLTNMGSEDANAFIVYDPSGEQPTVIDSATSAREYVRLPSGSWLTIDGLDIDMSNAALVVDGYYDEPTSNSSMDSSGDELYAIQLGQDVDNNNGRLSLVYRRYSNDAAVFNWESFNESGVIIDSGPSTRHTYIGSAAYHDNPGISAVKFSGLKMHTQAADYEDCYSSGYTDIPFTYAKTQPLGFNRFWYNNDNGYSNWMDIRWFMLFDDGNVDFGFINDMNKSRQYLVSKLIQNSGDNIDWLRWIYYGQSQNNTPFLYYNQPGMDRPDQYQGGGHTLANSNDPINNMPDDETSVISLPDSSSFTGQRSTEDNAISNSTSSFSTTAFIWNRNDTTRYKILHGQWGGDIEVWMNSRGGQFSLGDIEFTCDLMNVDQTVGTINGSFAPDGFHHLAIIRDGLKLQIWIDGVLEGTKVTPSIHPVRTSDNSLRFNGGPNYFSYWYFFNKAISRQEIQMMSNGFADVLKGICTNSGQPLPAVLAIADTQTNEIITQHQTENNGSFDIRLPKLTGRSINVLAIAQNDNDSNNIVVHGPYNMNTVYAETLSEVLDQSLADMILDMNPYAFYKMDETSGSTLADSSGNGRDGTVVGGVTFDHSSMSDGIRSIGFNGVDGYIDLPDGYEDFTNGFTVETWVHYEDFNNWSRIFETASADYGIHGVLLANSGVTSGIAFNAASTNGAIFNFQLASPSNSLVQNTWQHVVGRIAPNGDASIWLNGTKVAESLGNTLQTTILRTFNYIGRSSYPQDGYYEGKMSMWASYEHALSDEDIRKHAMRGFESNYQTLKSYIISDEPDIYFPFDRQDTYIDAIDGQLTLTKNGSFDVERNALVINKSTVGNNWLSTSNYNVRDTGNGWTIELGIKTGATHVDAVVVSEWNHIATAGSFKLMLDNSNKFKFYIGTDTTSIESTTLYNDDKWHHVVITYDGDTVRMYVDGNSESAISTSMAYNNHDLAIGNTSDGSATQHFEALTSLDDLAIYSKQLSDTQITEHYNKFIEKKVYQ